MPETLTDRQAEELRFGIRELQAKLEHYESLAVDQETIQEDNLVDQIDARDLIASLEREIEKLVEQVDSRDRMIAVLENLIKDRDQLIDGMAEALRNARQYIAYADAKHAAELAQLKASLY